MTKVYTIELPKDYTKCEISQDRTENNDHIAEQSFYKNDTILTKLEIHFDRPDNSIDGLKRWPYKIVVYDYDDSSKFIVEE